MSARDTQERWTQQLEVWAIDEMMEATEAQLSEAGAALERQTQAQGEPVRAPEQCPLEKAWGVCLVGECEWCRQEQAQGQAGVSQLVRDIAGVGKRPVSERHMPNLVSEAGDRGEVDKAEERKWATLGAGAVPPGTYCQTPQCHLVKRPRLRGLPD